MTNAPRPLIIAGATALVILLIVTGYLTRKRQHDQAATSPTASLSVGQVFDKKVKDQVAKVSLSDTTASPAPSAWPGQTLTFTNGQKVTFNSPDGWNVVASDAGTFTVKNPATADLIIIRQQAGSVVTAYAAAADKANKAAGGGLLSDRTFQIQNYTSRTLEIQQGALDNSVGDQSSFYSISTGIQADPALYVEVVLGVPQAATQTKLSRLDLEKQSYQTLLGSLHFN